MTDRGETDSVSNGLLPTLETAVSTSPFIVRCIARRLAIVSVMPAAVGAGLARPLAAVPAVEVALGRVVPTVPVAVPVAHPVRLWNVALGVGARRGRDADPRVPARPHAGGGGCPARGLLGGGVERGDRRKVSRRVRGGSRRGGLGAVPVVILVDDFPLVRGGDGGAPCVPQLRSGHRESFPGEGGGVGRGGGGVVADLGGRVLVGDVVGDRDHRDRRVGIA